MRIDLNELIPGSKYFRWCEALWLPQWGIHCYPTDRQYLNILKTVTRFDLVREYLDQPMFVTSWVRPKKYNDLIGGAFISAHIEGLAIDFQCHKIKPDRIREVLEPVLDDFNLRMEKLPGSNWVHIDGREPGPGGRYFEP